MIPRPTLINPPFLVIDLPPLCQIPIEALVMLPFERPNFECGLFVTSFSQALSLSCELIPFL